MPRRHVTFRRAHHPFPSDFPLRLLRFREESGMSWNQLARSLGTDSLALRRWRAGIRPNAQHLLTLLDLAKGLGLDHILIAPPVLRQDSPGDRLSSPNDNS